MTGNGSELSCITKSSITWVSTCGFTIAFGGQRSFTSSAVVASGRPLSDRLRLDSCDGTVPGRGTACTPVVSVKVAADCIEVCSGRTGSVLISGCDAFAVWAERPATEKEMSDEQAVKPTHKGWIDYSLDISTINFLKKFQIVNLGTVVNSIEFDQTEIQKTPKQNVLS